MMPKINDSKINYLERPALVSLEIPETGETKRKKVVTKHYSQPKIVS